MEFVEPLNDQTTGEGDSVTYKCMLNFDDVSVTWYKNGMKLHRARDVMITSEGQRHQLTLNNVSLDDQGKISIRAENLQVCFKLI